VEDIKKMIKKKYGTIANFCGHANVNVQYCRMIANRKVTPGPKTRAEISFLLDRAPEEIWPELRGKQRRLPQYYFRQGEQ